MMLNAIHIALSGLNAASKKVQAGASNIANMSTAGSLNGADNAPYTPLQTQQTAVTDGQGNGLGVQSTFTPKSPAFVPAYDPDSPFANEKGLIGTPNVDLAEEAVNLTLAKTTYAANVRMIETAEDMQDELLSLFDREV